MIVALALTAFLVGCTTRVGDFTAVANHSIAHPKPTRVGATGEDCTFIFQLGQMPSLEKAIDNAVRSAPGTNALVNVEVDYYLNPVAAVLWGRGCYRVRGDAVSIEGLQ